MNASRRGFIVLTLSASSAVVGAPCFAVEKNHGVADATVTREADGTVIVRWRTSRANMPVDVSLQLGGRAPRLVSQNNREGWYRLAPEDAALRPLIRLAAASGDIVTTAERVLPLEGGHNFRDIGGYSTADGRRVKWGMIYRSGTMVRLTDADYRLLSTLGIQVMCDFRTAKEREAEPTAVERIGTNVAYLTHGDPQPEQSSQPSGSAGPLTPAMSRARMLNAYGNIPYAQADNFKAMFRQIVDGHLPLAFNCAGGKDRTGVGAALLLTMLGVPRDTVVSDYAMTEKIVDVEKLYFGTQSIASGLMRDDPTAKMSPEVRAPFLRSDPAYLEHAFAEIDRREGSLANYSTKVLELSQGDIERIKSRLLE